MASRTNRAMGAVGGDASRSTDLGARTPAIASSSPAAGTLLRQRVMTSSQNYSSGSRSLSTAARLGSFSADGSSNRPVAADDDVIDQVDSVDPAIIEPAVVTQMNRKSHHMLKEEGSSYIGPEGFRMKIPPANSRLLVEKKSYSTPGPFIEGKTLSSIFVGMKARNLANLNSKGSDSSRSHGPIQLLRRRKPGANAVKTSESWNTVIYDRWSDQVRHDDEADNSSFLSWFISLAPDEDPAVCILFVILALMMMALVFVYVYLVLILIDRAQGASSSAGTAANSIATYLRGN